MDDLLHHFIVEARELVQQATDDLLALEHSPATAVPLESAFRAVHTLKGSVGLFDFAPMGMVLHAAEDLLGALKKAEGATRSEAIDSLLECIAQTECWVDVIERTGRLPADAAERGYRLVQALRSQTDDSTALSTAEVPVGDIAWIDDLIAASPDAAALRDQDIPLVAIRYTPRADCFFAGDDPVALLRSVPDLVGVRITNRDPWPPVAEIDPFACNLRIEALSRAGPDPVKAIFRFVPDQVTIHRVVRVNAADGPGGARDSSAALPAEATIATPANSRTLRVDARRIDRLADLVNEMVIAKNALAHLATLSSEGMNRDDFAQDLVACQSTIDRLVAEMHRAVMDVRMMPMRDVFRRFPRAVRDMASQSGKAVDFSLEGEDVEADKAVVEGLFEPLLHVLRNAVSHGAEPENIRRTAKKRATTKIILRARRDGDRVVVEVEDDGAGIDPVSIRTAALERGIISQEQSAQLKDADAAELIFAPGFSTASEVTDLSGRGVGMDAVRATVSSLGGHVGVQSLLGRGTTIRFSLPLSVVMTKVMAVRIGGELYGIPIDGVIETAFVPAERIFPIQEAEAFVLRDRTLPLVRLADLLSIPRSSQPAAREKILVLSIENEPVGVAVDGFAERMDVMMRPMAGILAGMPGIMGTTLLGDGRVLMVLDVPELIG